MSVATPHALPAFPAFPAVVGREPLRDRYACVYVSFVVCVCWRWSKGARVAWRRRATAKADGAPGRRGGAASCWQGARGGAAARAGCRARGGRAGAAVELVVRAVESDDDGEGWRPAQRPRRGPRAAVCGGRRCPLRGARRRWRARRGHGAARRGRLREAVRACDMGLLLGALQAEGAGGDQCCPCWPAGWRRFASRGPGATAATRPGGWPAMRPPPRRDRPSPSCPRTTEPDGVLSGP